LTNRIQILRSSITGNVPTAGTRQPGELWTNFPDLQLGVIDTAKNAQRLVAVRYFSTSANYVAGDFVVQAGVLYVAKGAITAGAFNAANWTQVASATDTGGPYLSVAAGASTYLPLAGGTMTGLVTLSGPPSNPLHAATKAYVDAGAFVPVAGGANTGLNDNRLVNGDIRIDQRNAGASGTATGYTVDRWAFGSNLTTKGNWQRYAGGPATLGFPYCLAFNSTSAYSSVSTDYFQFSQTIEADAISDFAWGTAGAQPITLSFLAFSSLTGAFSGCISNYNTTRSYPFSFSLSTANTWTKITLTIPGDTAGTWVTSGNGGSLIVHFDLGSGSTFRGPANAWASANYVGVTGSISVVATNAATFYLTGVKLEIGSVATPFNRQSLAKSLADCQRYYQQYAAAYLVTQGYNASPGPVYNTFVFPVVMRTGPTVTFVSPTYSNASNLVLSGADATAMLTQMNITATGYGLGRALTTLSAEL